MKEQWIKALRSGNYKQTTRRLRNSAGFCCLGVLCDISKEGSWNIDFTYQHEKEVCEGMLPPKLAEKVGIRVDGGGYFSKDIQPYIKKRIREGVYSLAELNDLGVSFEEIADILEHGA